MSCKGGTLKNGSDNYYPNAYYKVGDLFLTTNSDNPSARFGGTWELFGKGKTLVCVDTSDSDFSTVKKTGGEKKHKLTTSEMPSHNHAPRYSNNGARISLSNYGTGGYNISWTNDGTKNSGDIDTTYSGGDQAHNNLQPYITCYIWIRTA